MRLRRPLRRGQLVHSENCLALGPNSRLQRRHTGLGVGHLPPRGDNPDKFAQPPVVLVAAFLRLLGQPEPAVVVAALVVVVVAGRGVAVVVALDEPVVVVPEAAPPVVLGSVRPAAAALVVARSSLKTTLLTKRRARRKVSYANETD